MKMKTERIYRPIPGLTREDEEKQLQEVIGVAQENLEKTKKQIRELSEGLYEIYEMMEAEAEEAKQSMALVHSTQSQLSENRRELLRCQRARKKPYFGRIDFKAGDQNCEESYYIGRVGIARKGSEPLVLDWRAPLASVYYENTSGECTYRVKNEGTYQIDLKRKRTYEIQEDHLKDFFDSDVVANDELLTEYLAKNKNAVLGEIIATIQKEQNEVIRRTPRKNLIIQGAAGSGKTTVAMHRISYILYNYGEDFRPEDFYIIGSNRILLNYITSVLPDLDVYGVSQMTMEQLFVRLLYEDWDQDSFQIRPINPKDQWLQRKSSRQWFVDLEKFCREYEKKVIPCQEIRLEGTQVLLMDEARIRSCLENSPLLSLQGKINRLNEILMARLENEMGGNQEAYPLKRQKELIHLYRGYFGKKVWKGSIFSLYEAFLQAQRNQGKAVSYEENQFDLYDLAALAYLYKRIKETQGIREASHVIIDEAQDFGMMAYEAMAYCLRGCTYTIMGDVSQNIHFQYGLNDWEELKKLMLSSYPDGFGLLKKSYRNTVEIANFATEILCHGNFAVYPSEPINRHGEPVRVVEGSSTEGMIEETIRCIRRWREKGRETIAVICRDEKEGEALKASLGQKISLEDSNPETANFAKGVMVLPVEYTKGLEFDGVVLYHPSAQKYPAEDSSVKLLYVAATRALHELAVVHQGDLTELVGKSAGNKPMKRLEQKAETVKPKADERNCSQAPLPREKADHEPEGLFRKREKSPLREGRPEGLFVHHFGECPDISFLRFGEKEQGDCRICALRKTKSYLELISPYGTLRLTPVEAEIVRVQFTKKTGGDFNGGYWNCRPDSPVAWKARAGKNLVELETEKILIRLDKRTGALRFCDKEGNVLLRERQDLPRRITQERGPETWNYFDWRENEKVFAKGILPEALELMNRKARYISFKGKKLRMPLLLSQYGYGIGVAAKQSVACCMISLYGTFLYTDGTEEIDYYYLYGGNSRRILELYQKIN